MSKEYIFNTELLRYEKKKRSFRKLLLRYGLFTLFYVASVVIFLWITVEYWNTPRERVLIQQQKYLQSKYDDVKEELKKIDASLAAIEKKDNDIYRSIFEVNPIPYEYRKKGDKGNMSLELQDLTTSKDEMLKDIGVQIEQIANRIKTQKKSLQQIATYASNKAELIKAIPAIQPISNKQLIRLSSGFGYRIDPIYKVAKRHEGVDFTAPTGTPIYATAGGTISYSGYKFNGYGKHVIINHGYGYKTLYGHMSRIKAQIGQRVSRGELIGWVGSTGKSTAPHLHYEVIVNNNKVNPIYFFYSDLGEGEFEQLLERAQINNQSFD